MSTPQPLAPQARNRIMLSGTWAEGGFVIVLVTTLADGRIVFTPNVTGARGFAIEQDKLVEALLRWGRG